MKPARGGGPLRRSLALFCVAAAGPLRIVLSMSPKISLPVVGGGLFVGTLERKEMREKCMPLGPFHSTWLISPSSGSGAGMFQGLWVWSGFGGRGSEDGSGRTTPSL